ncbi:hypothetical protein PSACC_01565 [Paramicrosporidium saccamoebae]|uniref:Peptidase S54 rhomboid domain-containing protein n=1 Tax=Paramicrosporidium saccamoebae TaxID=1246581 RepID=A0A2H9TLJ1_9FUNG|nr:hypothetical protein PSACC_01565 [Paramicrosporidium saccamoebae]
MVVGGSTVAYSAAMIVDIERDKTRRRRWISPPKNSIGYDNNASLASWWNGRRESEKTIISLIGINGLVFLAWKFPGLQTFMSRYFMHSTRSHPITMLNSSFSHVSGMHFLVNMIALYSFGRMLHEKMGREQFLAFYLSAGLASSAGSHMVRSIRGDFAKSLGASGAVFAVAAGCAHQPDVRVSLIFLPFVSIPIGYALPAMMAYDAIGLVKRWATFDHAAHLSGALFGYIFYTASTRHIWPQRYNILKSAGNCFVLAMVERRLSTAPFQAPTMPSAAPRMSLAGPRQSLGPSRVRGSNVGTAVSELAGMSIGTEQRKLSLGRSSLDPRESLNRRSSAFGKNLAGTYAGGKDPRPIREKSYQLEVIKNLINFLAKSGYPHPISQKILTAPSAKDFQNIFKFLYAQLDPGYDFGKKFEDEVPLVMKGLRYPFAGEISKSQLYACGSMHAWPGLLAMLGWMVDLVNCCDILHAQFETEPSDMTDLPGSTQTTASEKVFFDYLCKSYKLFLAGSDNFDPLISELGASFERRNEVVYQEVEQLSRVVEEEEAEYQMLITEEPPLAKAQREQSIYKGDIEKFRKFISHLEVKRTKFDEVIRNTINDVEICERELEEHEMLRATLQAQVEAQDICPEDIDRMNSDKEQLVKTLESLSQTKEEANKVFWERELLVQKKLDAVEKLVQEYNYSGEQIAVIPQEAVNSKGLSLELAFNPHATRADQLVNLDIRTQVHPSFNSLREECHAMIHQAQDQLLSLQEALDKLNEACNDKIEELRSNEKKIERTVQSYLEEKESCAVENKKTDEEAELLEQTIQKLRSDISSHSIMSQQRLQRATVEYDQLVTNVASEKERIGTDMYRLLEELINFKTHVESSLEDLEQAFGREDL